MPVEIHHKWFGDAMHCPFCRSDDSRVVDSRLADDGAAVRRRRQCAACQRRFTTIEVAALNVVKRSGVVEPFRRDKIISGVRKACQGRLGQQVEDTLCDSGCAEVPAHEIGLTILGPLRDLDEVAYLRFASVYRAFDSLDDFEQEIALLKASRSPSGSRPKKVRIDITEGHKQALSTVVQKEGT